MQKRWDFPFIYAIIGGFSTFILFCFIIGTFFCFCGSFLVLHRIYVLIGKVIIYVLYLFLLQLCLILSAAFLTLFERQTLSIIHHRKGPNVVGFWGLVQPFADALKLVFKEPQIPLKADKFLFIFASLFVLVTSLLLWVIIPLDGFYAICELNVAFLYFLVFPQFQFMGWLYLGGQVIPAIHF